MSKIREGAPRESLVQYENPIEYAQDTLNSGGMSGIRKPNQLSQLESKPNNDDILNAILPPREWIQENRHMIQYVSINSSSREDVANLQKQLDERLLARQARFKIII